MNEGTQDTTSKAIINQEPDLARIQIDIYTLYLQRLSRRKDTSSVTSKRLRDLFSLRSNGTSNLLIALTSACSLDADQGLNKCRINFMIQ